MSRKTIVQTINSVKPTTNIQRVALKLLKAEGEWVPRSQLTRIPSATRRARELRSDAYGAFAVECKSSEDLDRKVSKKTYYYRINPNKVSRQQISTLFKLED